MPRIKARGRSRCLPRGDSAICAGWPGTTLSARRVFGWLRRHTVNRWGETAGWRKHGRNEPLVKADGQNEQTFEHGKQGYFDKSRGTDRGAAERVKLFRNLHFREVPPLKVWLP